MDHDDDLGLFSIEPLRYTTNAVPRRFVDALGPRAAFLGHESGTFEAWIWPLKICRDLKLAFRTDGRLDPIEASSILTNVEVAPHRIVLSYAHQDFTVQQTLTASPDDRLLLMILDVDLTRPLTIEVAFVPEFVPMWPAALGGQIVRVDEQSGAILLTEELGRYAALIGSRDARARASVDRGLPKEPLRLEIPVDFDRAEEGPVVIVLAGAEVADEPLADAAKLGRMAAACGESRLERVVDQARTLFQKGVDDAVLIAAEHEARWRGRLNGWSSFGHDESIPLYWSGAAVTKAWAEVDGLGRGLLAGLAPSGSGTRPGFGWFFDGDAMTAGDAMGLLGEDETPAAVLRRAASHQNADGKMMHELTLSARLCNWFEDFPYAYYKSENTAAFLVYLGAHVRRTDDRELAAELAPQAERAVLWIAGRIDDDGHFSIPRAGLGAVEAGPLAAKIRSEVYSQGLVIAGLRAFLDLYDDAATARTNARALLGRAEAAFETFWSEAAGRYAFAVLESGELLDDLSGYLGLPLALGVGRKDRAERTAAALNHPDLMTEWGVRMFAASSSVYDPSHYNTGSVFPYLQGFAIRALYAHGQLEAARQALDSLLGLESFEALGLIPEHLVGDRCVTPERGVPHQIFSSSALIHALVEGSIGWRQSAANRLLELAPAISDRFASIVVIGERLKNGRDRFTVDYENPVGDELALPEDAEESGGVEWPPKKKKKAGRALPPPFDFTCEIGAWDGCPPTTLRLAPRFPAHTSLISAQIADAAGRPRRLKTTIETIGQATVIACEDVRVASQSIVTLRVRRGPHFLHPPLGTYFPGSRSRAARFCFERVGTDDVRWTIWGETRSTETFDVRSDRACEWSGGRFDESRGTLELVFPETPGAEWVPVVVTARILD